MSGIQSGDWHLLLAELLDSRYAQRASAALRRAWRNHAGMTDRAKLRGSGASRSTANLPGAAHGARSAAVRTETALAPTKLPAVLFWTGTAIWNNAGDKAELRDNFGNLISGACYSSSCPQAQVMSAAQRPPPAQRPFRVDRGRTFCFVGVTDCMSSVVTSILSGLLLCETVTGVDLSSETLTTFLPKPYPAQTHLGID